MDFGMYTSAKLYNILGNTKNSYNKIDKPNEVKIQETQIKLDIGTSKYTVNLKSRKIKKEMLR
jgi:hypothetical protein